LSAKTAGVHQKGSFTVQDAIDNIKSDPDFPKAGAIGLFVGVVRGKRSRSYSLKLTKKKPIKF
jgi:molybdopterin synthase catalytic subunit